VDDLLAYLDDDVDVNSPFTGLHAGPGKADAPDVWLLGSRMDSAALAAEMGLPFSYAYFFGLSVEQGPVIVDMYRRNFKPSKHLAEPLVNVAVQVLCAETEEEALRLSASRNVSRVKSVQGMREGVPPVEEALAYEFRPDERAYVESLKQFYVDGNPQQVKAGLDGISEEFGTNDLTVVTITYDFRDRVRSYELVAEVCGLTGLSD
jgi:luciferase family oxidoreductase group 1